MVRPFQQLCDTTGSLNVIRWNSLACVIRQAEPIHTCRIASDCCSSIPRERLAGIVGHEFALAVRISHFYHCGVIPMFGKLQ